MIDETYRVAERLAPLARETNRRGTARREVVLFTRKVHRKLGGNFTFLILTDRDDLDTQIYKTFAGCGVADNDRDIVAGEFFLTRARRPVYYSSHDS